MGIMMHDNDNLEYRVGYSPISGGLYAGFVRRDSGKWEGQPQEVTNWAMFAVGQKLCREGNDMLFPLPDGRVMQLSATIGDADDTEVADAQA
ncbi:hypothetical protein NYP84_15950 [Erwinia pyrifoliae]|uniref:Uncharacterized protein n=2 Tax=Erwinia pyrifoliae TaxID=79967 RepID=A0ABY5X6Q3_ERWPY|nr:hypothetical protein NYP84_15950 [Erwinia pyrifoliae]